MKIEKLYTIKEKEWTAWNKNISDAIDNFFASFSYYPDILEANDYTYSQIDFLINEIPGEKQNLRKIDDFSNKEPIPLQDEYVKISGFDNIKASLEFATDNELKDKEFRLIYDSDPDWGDEETGIDVPVEELELVF
jgi:hypothetical protein